MQSTEEDPISFPKTPTPPPEQIEKMFDAIVARYDIFNTVLSLGLEKRWRKAIVRSSRVGVPSVSANSNSNLTTRSATSKRVLDLGCGTGALTITLPPTIKIVGIDLSRVMLETAHKRLSEYHGEYSGDLSNENGCYRNEKLQVGLSQASAYELPFADATFDAVLSAFVLRNLHERQTAFDEVARVTKPGGKIALLDMTEPTNSLMDIGFKVYFHTIAPLVGLAAGHFNAYRYLSRSYAQLPSNEQICLMLAKAGFVHTTATPFTGGVVTLFNATRL
ncbi:MAG: ubiquinone/menaquinone biosynthesis methyltransferase [Actinobacteria bacterium]|nr:ubiquinone/menaquinone biosynthesis methyltransferase [Actinomycetota bacterium]MCL6104646.1 ubiquinone/menaquinone biosynthesis methyltransferase [Actinomycetota bacterium]